ncbi:MAG: hypothetical protein ACYS18_08085 [Planctomycetota bacterium]
MRRGADFDDDGGVRSRWGEERDGGDQVFWPVNERGEVVVFCLIAPGEVLRGLRILVGL